MRARADQAKLAEKAPLRRRSYNEFQNAMLRGLLTDPEGRPMVPSYGSSGTIRYCYYESRRDLARKGMPPATRFQRGQLERHIVEQLTALLTDEHALRRLSGLSDAEALQRMLQAADQARVLLQQPDIVEVAVRQLVSAIGVGPDEFHLSLDPSALMVPNATIWRWSISRPARKPFREAKLRIAGPSVSSKAEAGLVDLLREARKVQKLVLASPHLTLLQLEKREGRCRKQMAKLLRLSWLSPRAVEAIVEGKQHVRLTRRHLLGAELPLDWPGQAELLGLAA